MKLRGKNQPQDNGRVSCGEDPQLSKRFKHMLNGRKDLAWPYVSYEMKALVTYRHIMKKNQAATTT